jgi:hypothetical protein
VAPFDCETSVGPVAEHREVELARELLTHDVRGLANSLWNRVSAPCAVESNLDYWQEQEFSNLKSNFTNRLGCERGERPEDQGMPALAVAAAATGPHRGVCQCVQRRGSPGP